MKYINLIELIWFLKISFEIYLWSCIYILFAVRIYLNYPFRVVCVAKIGLLIKMCFLQVILFYNLKKLVHVS